MEDKDYKIVVKNVPEGWVIESIVADGKPPLINKDTYPAENIPPGACIGTEWHIGTTFDANKVAKVQFELYSRTNLLYEKIDTVSVSFAHYTYPIQNIVSPLLLVK